MWVDKWPTNIYHFSLFSLAFPVLSNFKFQDQKHTPVEPDDDALKDFSVIKQLLKLSSIKKIKYRL